MPYRLYICGPRHYDTIIGIELVLLCKEVLPGSKCDAAYERLGYDIDKAQEREGASSNGLVSTYNHVDGAASTILTSAYPACALHLAQPHTCPLCRPIHAISYGQTQSCLTDYNIMLFQTPFVDALQKPQRHSGVQPSASSQTTLLILASFNGASNPFCFG